MFIILSFNSSLRQCINLYRAVSQRKRVRRDYDTREKKNNSNKPYRQPTARMIDPLSKLVGRPVWWLVCAITTKWHKRATIARSYKLSSTIVRSQPQQLTGNLNNNNSAPAASRTSHCVCCCCVVALRPRYVNIYCHVGTVS